MLLQYVLSLYCYKYNSHMRITQINEYFISYISYAIDST